MRIVPVIDLQGGRVVHAARGQRETYRPLRSGIVAGARPLAVADALLTRAGSEELYVADLDAIAGRPPNAATLRQLARRARVMADLGATTTDDVARVRALGVAVPVIATETLAAGRLHALLAAEAETPVRHAGATRRPNGPIALSLDLRGGRIVSADPALQGRRPLDALGALRDGQLDAVLVLDLDRVGSGLGPPLEAVAAVAAALPQTPILAGGGVRDAADLNALQRAGAAGALVATALHAGALP